MAAPWLVLLLAPLMSLLAGCSPIDLLNWFTPQAGYAVKRDLAYGERPRQRLDLYTPQGAAADAPLVMFVYGGAWESGSKADYTFAAQAFTEAGYIVAIPDYRLYPDVVFPAFVEDTAQALDWLLARFGNDRPVHLIGHSSGAYNVVMVALDPRWLAAHRRAPCSAVSSVVGLAGPYDFLPFTTPDLFEKFPEQTRADSQPIHHARGDAPPLLLVHGRNDSRVKAKNSINLAAAVTAEGGRASLHLEDKLRHELAVATLGAPLRWLKPTRQLVLSFLAANDRPPACPDTD